MAILNLYTWEFQRSFVRKGGMNVTLTIMQHK